MEYNILYIIIKLDIFLNPFFSCRASGLFLYLSYSEQCCNNHGCPSVFIVYWLTFFLIYAQNDIIGSYGSFFSIYVLSYRTLFLAPDLLLIVPKFEQVLCNNSYIYICGEACIYISYGTYICRKMYFNNRRKHIIF
jgi:hypothetical protein